MQEGQGGAGGAGGGAGGAGGRVGGRVVYDLFCGTGSIGEPLPVIIIIIITQQRTGTPVLLTRTNVLFVP